MENEKRLIDGNVFAEHLERMARTAYPNVLPGLMEAAEYARDFLPTVDAVEVVHGWWEPHPRHPGFDRCSVCRDCIIADDWADGKKWNYCPNCGAKMDGGTSP